MKKLLFSLIALSIITGSCFAASGIKTKNSKSGNNSKEIDFTKMTKLTELQKTMAEKAVKLPSENNPLAIHKLTADPCVLVYNDTVYVYGTNDAQQAEATLGKQDNSYNRINTINVFSSKDLVNWTDCGEIPVAGRNNSKGAAKWANNSWAPAIAYKKINGKDKFFLYFADNGSGIGVVTSDSPTGPFTDPIGKQLISRSTPNCSGAEVPWLFDPAVFVDTDGTGYLYFGGGVPSGKAEHPKSGRCVKLGDDMISLAGEPKTIDAPWLFEDSGINKIGKTYYYSYCANWDDRAGAAGTEVPPCAVIAYMTSESPLGPFKYAGYTLKNPGNYFGAWGNNHHWIFNFKNQWYIAFHAQTTEKMLGFEKGGYRSIFIDEINVNGDGSLPVQNVSKEGAASVCSFNPYEKIPAATFHSSANMAVSSKQTLVPVKNSAYVLLKNVDFSKGASKITMTVSEKSEGSVRFVSGSRSGSEIANIEVKGGTNSYDISFPSDAKKTDNLYIVVTGSVELIDWQFK